MRLHYFEQRKEERDERLFNSYKNKGRSGRKTSGQESGKKGAGNRRNSGNGWFVHYCPFIVCGNEGQFDRIYQDIGGSNDCEGTADIDGSDGVKRESGNIGDFMAAGICMLMLTALLIVYMDSIRLIDEKAEINQIARKYILRMESVGMLTDADSAMLYRELTEAGAAEVNLEGSTFVRAGYGEAIVLCIRGKLRGRYEFEEKRVSTAKY